jgi:hypothetical protein
LCFSATANFVGSGVLGAVGVVTLTRVKHRRELLFASLPTLFAIHQFTEGFVWLGLDGTLSPTVTHDMAAAFMLYAQGLLPFLLPPCAQYEKGKHTLTVLPDVPCNEYACVSAHISPHTALPPTLAKNARVGHPQ